MKIKLRDTIESRLLWHGYLQLKNRVLIQKQSRSVGEQHQPVKHA